jgi:hypothetical protein
VPADAGLVTAWVRGQAPAKSEGRVRLSLRVPGQCPHGRWVIPVDLVYGGRDLPQFTEGILVI